MNSKRIRLWLFIIAAVAICVIFGNLTAYLFKMLIVSWVVAFALEPLCDKLSKRFSREASAWLSLAIVIAGLTLISLILLPPLVTQALEIVKLLPEIAAKARELLDDIAGKLSEMGLGQIGNANIGIDDMAIDAVYLAAQSFSGFASGATAFFLGVMLGVFILIDIDQSRLKAELLIPLKYRALAVRMSRDVSAGLRMYVKGQLTVCAIVGALSALFLWLAGVKSPAALGAMAGAFNIIPYFGPILASVPVIMTALTQSVVTALFAAASLFAVQQIDGMFISPKVMSGATGLKPAQTLIAMSVGGAGWGVVGMLLALPAAIIVKIAARTWASRNDY